MPDDLNVNTEESEKLYKYKVLKIKVSRMWKVRTKIVPVIIVTMGKIKKGSDQNIYLLPGIRSEPSFTPRLLVSHKATEDHINEHCTHHL
jgi:hypothetical protein